MRVPLATYRLQLRSDFGFREAAAVLDYLRDLGLTDIYLSPVFQARAGSPHGYDVTDPNRFNQELGGDEGFNDFADAVRARGMGLLLDIVPNHMAASPENPWWRDVLRHGPASRHADFFDIDWTPAWDGIRGRVLLPILGRPYGEALESSELSVALEDGEFVLRHFDHALPLDPRTVADLLEAAGLPDLARLAGRIPSRRATARRRRETRARLAERLREALRTLVGDDAEAGAALESALVALNGTPGRPESFAALDRLIVEQAYHLAYWKTALEEINYRRFFDISDLASVRVEEPEVFDATHALIRRVVAEGRVTGVRVDHVDGLHDPGGYLRRLAAVLGEGIERWRGDGYGNEGGFYVLVEKILAPDEALPSDWPVAGTTGYDFLNAAGRVFVEPRGRRALRELYARLTRRTERFEDVAYEKKKQVATQAFTGEIRTLQRWLARLAERDRHARDLAPRRLGRALVEVTACLHVYRTYVRGSEIPDADRDRLRAAADEARRRNPVVEGRPFAFLRRVLLRDAPPPPGPRRRAWLRFVLRWQQFTGPAMAKGVEDTALYVYNPLVSLNEVGGEPDARTGEADALHRFLADRAGSWPGAMNATSTHDTKRSEDVRARLHVLPELAEEWAVHVRRWRRANRRCKRRVRGREAPDSNEELLLYQTLLGAWPLREEEVPAFRDRLDAYLVKALREAKEHSSWLGPDAAYEEAVQGFVRRVLGSGAESRAGAADTGSDNDSGGTALGEDAGDGFRASFRAMQRRVAFYGAINSLSQLVLKLGAPGVPDFYQGTELWDFSLVDPDNRRPVDFEARARALDALRRDGPDPADLLRNWRDGRIKLWLTHAGLRARSRHDALFRRGGYLPLEVTGERARHLFAFARFLDRGDAGGAGVEGAAGAGAMTSGDAGGWAVVACARFPVALAPGPERFPLGEAVWGDVALRLPDGAPRVWTDAFTGARHEANGGVLSAASLFADFPSVILISG